MSCDWNERMKEMLFEEGLAMGMSDEEAEHYAEEQFEMRMGA